jgi:outer membrane receptor protein involved in Fe transport
MYRHHTSHTASRITVLLLASVLSAVPLWAQQTAATPATPDNKNTPPRSAVEKSKPADGEAAKEENVLELSPFVVKASEYDSRYFSENTLAGSRLNTNIGDLAASITVVTRQQMLDTASIDMNDVFMYEANTEGTNSNYNSFAYDGTSFRDFTQASPVTANRIRGIGAADRAHNYYASLSQIPFDVYNTETIEISRGPNSLLFGLGSAAGIVNQSSSNANLRKSYSEIGTRVGKDSAFRGSIRYNHVLIPKKLAIFVAGLEDKRGFARKPSYDNSHRKYVAFTYAPTRTTTIRASFEHFTQEFQRPNSVTPQDGITEWKANGSPTWNPLTFTVTTGGVSTTLPPTSPNNVAGLRAGTGGLPTMFIYNGQVELWMQAALSSVGLLGPFPGTLPQLSLSTTAIQKLQQTTMPLFNISGVTDRSLYDWSSINITNGNRTENLAKVFHVDINQELARNLYLSAGWYREEYSAQVLGYNTPGFLSVDTNTVLLDGTPNPYFKKITFRGSNNGVSEPDIKNDNMRLSLAYKLDFTKKQGWLKWLGYNQFFAFGERRKVDSLNMSKQEVVLDNGHLWANPLARTQGTPGATNVSWSLQANLYVGDIVQGVTNGGGYMPFGPLSTKLRNAVPTGVQTGTGTYTWVNEPVTLGLVPNSNTRATRQTDDSFTLGWQGSLIGDRIIPTIGFRRDRNVSDASLTLPHDPATGLWNLKGLSKFGPALVTFGNTITKGIVVKPLKWVSFNYGLSENFTPAAIKLDISGNPLPLPVGTGKDYGVRINLWNSKLVLGINSFESSANDARGTPADGFMFRTARFETGFIVWANGVANTELGAGASASAVASRVAQLTKLPLGYTPPALGAIGSTSTVNAEGIEASLIYNPIPNWNIKVTYGTQKTVYSNIAPEYDAYTTPRLPVWQAAVDPNTGESFWSTPSSPDLGVPLNFFNQNILAPMQLAQALQGKRTQGQREWSASGIMTYRFVRGRLKGSMIGGAVRLQDSAIIGYYGEPDSKGVIRSLNATRPVFDDPIPSYDFWVSKSFPLPKLFGKNISAKVQLNVKNAFEKGNWLQPINTNPDGTFVAYRIVEPRAWYLDVNLSF